MASGIPFPSDVIDLYDSEDIQWSDSLQATFTATSSELYVMIVADKAGEEPMHLHIDNYALRQNWVSTLNCDPNNPNNTFAEERRYRYGFNNKENDNEVAGFGNWQDYGMRMYSPRLGRFNSADPLIVMFQKYPELSAYQFASNMPIQAVDLDGLEAMIINTTVWQDSEGRQIEHSTIQFEVSPEQQNPTYGDRGILRIVRDEIQGRTYEVYTPGIVVAPSRIQKAAQRLYQSDFYRWSSPPGSEFLSGNIGPTPTIGAAGAYIEKGGGYCSDLGILLFGTGIGAEAGAGFLLAGRFLSLLGGGMQAIENFEEGNNQEGYIRVGAAVTGEITGKLIQGQLKDEIRKEAAGVLTGKAVNKIQNNIIENNKNDK
jgi:RHS repeat-associated protein